MGKTTFAELALSLSPTLKQNVPKIKEFLSIENEA